MLSPVVPSYNAAVMGARNTLAKCGRRCSVLETMETVNHLLLTERLNEVVDETLFLDVKVER